MSPVGQSYYPRALGLYAAHEAEGLGSIALAPDLGFTCPKVPSAALRAAMLAFLGPKEERRDRPAFRAFCTLVAAPTLPVRELLAYPVRYLGSIPLGYTAHARLVRHPKPLPNVPGKAPRPPAPPTITHWAWSTSREGFASLLAGGKCCAWLARELEYAAYALDQGRAGPRDMDSWCALKVGRDWRLSAAHARCTDVAAYREGVTFSSLCVGDLMEGLGAELVAVEEMT